MMRIGIPNGMVSASQLRLIGGITRKYARNLADITVRQNIQLHWLTIESLPEIVDALDAIGLSPKGACGDVVRNVTGCPLAGVAADELIDASPVAREIAHHLTANPEFYNLPRKFKISVTGCPAWCTYPEINDIGLTPVRRGGRDDEVGYSLRVGGGLSNEPHLAVRLDAFVRPDQAVRVVRGVAEIFRDQQALRESRERARLKYLFMREGWTAESFLDELHRRIGFKLDPAVPEEVPDEILRDHVGIHPQRQPGLAYVGASVLRGRMTGEQLEAVAELAERFGSGSLRATVSQNLVIVDVPYGKTTELARELGQIGLHVDGLALLARRHRLHRHRVLQAGDYRDQGLHALAGRRARRAAAAVRPAAQAARYRLPQRLRPALDRRHRPRRQEDQVRRQADRCLLLLPGRSGGPARGHRAASGLSLPRAAGA